MRRCVVSSRPGVVVPLAFASWAFLTLAGSLAAAETEPTPEQLEFFEKRVRPVFAQYCYECHSGDEPKANFRLDVRAGMMQGGDSGPAVVPGKPDESLLVSALNYDPDGYQMPPKGKLKAEEIAAVVKWVEEGAPWPAEAATGGVKKGFDLAERKAKHWSFQPLASPPIPAADDAAWAKTPIDLFLLAKLEAAGLPPNGLADKRTLIRRATFDLTGLPPTPAEIDAFLADDSPEAFEKVVDRLLASPRYGERWGRHWLDLVRYAETYGHEFDFEIPNAYQYRDYVIRAFNADLPFDQFVKEHVAGDLLPEPRRRPDTNANESVVGTGFWHFGEAKHSPVDVRGDEADRFDNQIDVFAKTFLGLTVSCARCHDHKFDAISTKDYYALAGFLQSSRYQQAFIDDRAPVLAKANECAALAREANSLVGAALASSPGARRTASAEAILAAAKVLREETTPDSPATLNPGDRLLEDFEGDSYKTWTVEGEAFGARPNRQPIPQGKIHEIGAGFVNTYTVSRDGGRVQGDQLTGKLTSAPFTIERNYLHFLVGGGRHPGKACVNLLVDDRVVRTATGRNDDVMRWERFDLASLRGRTARVQILDDDKSEWCQIGVDQLILSDAPFGPRQRAIEAASAELKADPHATAAWVRVLDHARSKRAPTSLSPLANLLLAPHESGDAFAQAAAPLVAQAERFAAAAAATSRDETIFEDFSRPGWNGWFVTGEAFGDGPTASPEPLLSDDAARPLAGFTPAGVAHSGRVAHRLQGALRSPTFELTKKHLQIRLAGRGKVNVVVDGLLLIRYPIYGDLTFDVDRPNLAWHSIDVSMWAGHRCYLEFLDEGDGWLAVDEIRRSDAAPPGDSRTSNVPLAERVLLPAPADRATLATRLATLLADLAKNLEAGALSPGARGDAEVELIEFLVAGDLWSFPSSETAADDASRERIAKLADLLKRRREIASSIPFSARAPAMCDGTAEDEAVHIRGSHKNLGPRVERRLLEGLGGVEKAPRGPGSGRLALAEQLLDVAQNPLTPRVLVNRLWHHHFGRGLVASCDDFGNMGQAPTHPELLDWLAGDFVAHGWSIKRMHRLIMLSAIYQTSSRPSAESLAIDPLNRLWSRTPIRRLEAEAIRDSILLVSGRLEDRPFGPSVMPHLTPFMNGRGRPGSSGPLDGDGRRSLYVNVRRNFLTPFFLAFDYPQPFTTIGRRSVSNVPAQALALLNNPFVLQQADLWAQRTLAEPAESVDDRVKRMYLAAFAREPREDELAAANEFLRSQREKHSGDERAAWRDFAHVLFNVKEFIFVN